MAGHVRERPCHAPLEPREHPALGSFQKLIKGFLQRVKFSKPIPDLCGLSSWPRGGMPRPGAQPPPRISTARRAAAQRGQLPATERTRERRTRVLQQVRGLLQQHPCLCLHSWRAARSRGGSGEEMPTLLWLSWMPGTNLGIASLRHGGTAATMDVPFPPQQPPWGAPGVCSRAEGVY